jgi:hypothetical protein
VSAAPDRPWSASIRRPWLGEQGGGPPAGARKSETIPEVRADRTAHYEDGSTRQYGVQVACARGGRDFTSAAKEARSSKEAEDLELSGAVKLLASDGFQLDVEQATYSQEASVVSAPG